jgi:hypothetical protein
MRNARNIFVGEREGKMPLQRPRYMCESSIKVDLWEIGHADVVWIHLS